MIQFDEHIFQMGLVQPPTTNQHDSISSASQFSRSMFLFGWVDSLKFILLLLTW